MADLVQRIGRRVAMALGIGRQTADTNEQPSTPTVQVALAAGEMRSDVPFVQDYGFASRPVPGSDVVVMFQAGDRARGVAIASGDQRNRPKDLKPGEVCLFHPPSGSQIRMMHDGTILIKPSAGKGTWEGDLAVTGDMSASGTVSGAECKAGGIALTTHTHTGVQPGSGESGPPAK
ncbi:phage baseplate assembly protein [Acetobacter persici]|uniref:phage baseplate assembly protein domain-containing protein n=1 Tax=Acetobacter persici TaxID=1076596 RepID=UPI0039EC65D7